MGNTTKVLSNRDAAQTLQAAFNENDHSLTTAAFVTSKLGNKISKEITTTNVANDTEVYSYFDSAILLYKVTVVYTSADRDDFLSAERTE